MNNSLQGDDTYEKATEAGHAIQQRAKKAVTSNVKNIVKEFAGSITGHERNEVGAKNYDTLTATHLQKFEKNYDAQDAQKMEDLKQILFKHVNEDSAKAVQEREQAERERLRLMEEDEMRDQQEKQQEQGGMVATPQGKAQRGKVGSQVKKNTQAETRGGKSQF